MPIGIAMQIMFLRLAALGLAFAAAPALSDDAPPRLDVERTCSSSGRAQVQVQTSQKDSQDGCLRSERAAHDELKKRWRQFTPEAKSQCTKQSQAGGFPSYVETITCLELASGTAPGQADAGARPRNPKSSKESLTAEPSPKQRTNPLEVLDKK